GRAKAKVAAKAAAGPTMAECRRVAERLRMVADGTRVAVLLSLADGEKNVTTMTKELDSTQPAVSHHLCLMKMSGTIEARRQGKSNFYGVTPLGRSLLAAVRTMLG